MGTGSRATFDTGLPGNAVCAETGTQRDARHEAEGRALWPRSGVCTSPEAGKSWPVHPWEHAAEKEGWRDLTDDAGKAGRRPILKGLVDRKEKHGRYSQSLGEPWDHRVGFL